MNKTEVNEKLRTEIHEHAWKSFSIHADQRLKTFHFFVLLCTLVAGGIFTILKDGSHLLIGGLLCLLLPFLSFIFWKLETRNRQLVKHAEAALKFIEDQWDLPPQGQEPHPARIFWAEEHATNRLPRFPRSSLFRAHLSYARCFNAVFAVFGIGGAIVGVALCVAAYLIS